MAIKPDPNFRPDPNRAIYVHGKLEAELIRHLTRDIIRLQTENRSPITVFIDSPGGELSSAAALWGLLTAPNQDHSKACRIITVVTTRAASAAADLLSSGDYAMAYPQSTVLYHGSRMYFEQPLTMEFSSAVTQYLRRANDRYALDLLRKIEDRFMRRLIFSTQGFEEIRRKNAHRKMSDADCFLALVRERLSDGAKKVFDQASARRDRYDSLINSVVKKTHKSKSKTKTEANRLKAIIDFEKENNKKDRRWTFRSEGMNRIADDFFLINEYLTISESPRISQMCTRWGKFSLSSKEQEKIDKITEEKLKDEKLVKIVRPKLIPLWTFFVGLCHVLQEGENELTARDAYWLGLIDEIIGDQDTAAFRNIFEFEEDPAPKKEQVSEPPDK